VLCRLYCAVLYRQNYNKSRIHSSRGARDIEVTLDGAVIFVGEIVRASGDVIGTSECFGDVRIVFSFCQIQSSDINNLIVMSCRKFCVLLVAYRLWVKA